MSIYICEKENTGIYIYIYILQHADDFSAVKFDFYMNFYLMVNLLKAYDNSDFHCHEITHILRKSNIRQLRLFIYI